MNKQELLEQVNGLPSTLLDKRLLIDKSAVLELVNQLNESQKVVIPQFMDSFIKYAKGENMSLFIAMDNAQNKESDWIVSNEELFARAWLDGYEVEKEKLYTVEIPSPVGGNKLYLVKNGTTGTLYIHVGYLTNYIKNSNQNKHTEAEIKQDFEWAWNAGFAKEVKE